MLLTLSGPGGSGKTTALAWLMQLGGLSRFLPLPSLTTRPPRPTDLRGEYQYITDFEFNELKRRGEFAWTVQPHNTHRYGTLKTYIEAALQPNGDVFVAILVPEVVSTLFATLPTEKHTSILPIYLWIDDEAQLRSRLTRRKDSAKDIQARLEQMPRENKLSSALSVDFFRVDATQPPNLVCSTILRHYLDRLAAAKPH